MTSPSDPLPANPPLMLGPRIVGIILNWFFYGILTMQYLMYLNNSRGDKKWLRGMVHVIFLLDTIQSIMMMDDLFFWFVYNFNDYSAAASEFHLVTIDGPFLDALIMFTAQIVYCWRLKELGEWTVLPVATAFMFVDSTAVRRYAPVEDLWLLASAVTDIIITSSMTYLLMKYQKEYRFMRKTMMTRLKRMAMLTLETGALTATISIALFIFVITPSLAELNINLALGSVIGKIYSNCFMVLLNQRIYYDKYAKMNTATVILGGTSRIPGDGQNETTGPPMSMLQFNDTWMTIGTSTTTSEPSQAGVAKNDQELISSVPNEIV